MCKLIVAVLCWALAVQGQYYDGLDTLGERISASVANNLRPLEGLGERISAQVQQNLRPMQVSAPFLHFFETPVMRKKRDTVGLEGLGESISQNVYQQLEPVRAIELNFKMRDGVGGTTIVIHRPSGRQFIIRNYKTFSCSDPINTDNGNCPGTLTPFEITASSPQTDWCFMRSYSLINNQVCLSVGSVSVYANNGHVTCQSTDNKPTILMSLDDYKKTCSSVSESAEYRYIPNENDPAHVAIPNENRYVKCENTQENYCIFNERNGLLDSYASGGGVYINNGVSKFASVSYF